MIDNDGILKAGNTGRFLLDEKDQKKELSVLADGRIRFSGGGFWEDKHKRMHASALFVFAAHGRLDLLVQKLELMPFLITQQDEKGNTILDAVFLGANVPKEDGATPDKKAQMNGYKDALHPTLEALNFLDGNYRSVYEYLRPLYIEGLAKESAEQELFEKALKEAQAQKEKTTRRIYTVQEKRRICYEKYQKRVQNKTLISPKVLISFDRMKHQVRYLLKKGSQVRNLIKRDRQGR